MGIGKRVCAFLAVIAFLTVCASPALVRMEAVQRVAWQETMDPNTDEVTDDFWRLIRRL